MSALRRLIAWAVLMACGALIVLAAPWVPGTSGTRAGGTPGTPTPPSGAAASDAAAKGVRAIVLTGQRAPAGGTFTEFSDPSINDHGDLAFGGLTTNPRAHAALYLLSGGRLRMLVASGQPAPTGGMFTSFNDVVLNSRGTILFLARTTDRVSSLGLYLVRDGTVVPIVAAGQPTPVGGVFTDFANPTINDRDVVAFVGRINGPGREGIFTTSEGTTTAAVLGGQSAPTGGMFQFFLDGTPAENSRGQIAFVASTTAQSTQGIYVLTGGRTVPVVTTNDTAPVGGPFTEFGFVTLTDAGTVGFVGRTARSAVHEGLYVTGRAQLVMLARQGQVVAGSTLTTFANAAMNEEEEMVFQLGTPDPIARAVYVATRTGVRAVSKVGDPAPAGGRFSAYSTPSLNARGQVAFVAQTDDGRHGVYLGGIR